MNWTSWLLIGVSFGAIYALGLVLYRLWLSAKALKKEIDTASRLVAEAQEFEQLEPIPAQPSSPDELGKLIRLRRRFVRAREKMAEDRQRRLVQRIRDIEIDKR